MNFKFYTMNLSQLIFLFIISNLDISSFKINIINNNRSVTIFNTTNETYITFNIFIRGSDCYQSDGFYINDQSLIIIDNGMMASSKCTNLQYTINPNISQVTVYANVRPASNYIISLMKNVSIIASVSFTSPSNKSSVVRNISVVANISLSYFRMDWSTPQNPNGQIMAYLALLSDLGGRCLYQWWLFCVSSTAMGTQDSIMPLPTCQNNYNNSFNINDQRISIESSNISLNYSGYNVLLVPINDYGWGYNTSMKFTTIPYTVQNLSVVSNVNTLSFVIQWSPPAKLNQDVLQYVVWVMDVSMNNCVGYMTISCTDCPSKTVGTNGDSGVMTRCSNVSTNGIFTMNTSTFSVVFASQSISRCSYYVASVAAITQFGWGNNSTSSTMIGQCGIAGFSCYPIEDKLDRFICSWSMPFISPIVNYTITCSVFPYFQDYLPASASSIIITGSVYPEVLYLCEIFACTITDCGQKSAANIKLQPSIYPDIVDMATATKVMYGQDKPFSPSQIYITLPYGSVTERSGRIVSFSLIVVVSSVMAISNSSTSAVEKTYTECDRGRRCPYVISLIPTIAQIRRKRAMHSLWVDSEFIIGFNNTCATATNCNGPLEPNTEYSIGFRVCTSAGCLAIVIRKSTTKNLTIAIAVPVTVIIVLVIVGILLALYLRRRRRGPSQSQRSSLIPRDQLENSIVNHFEDYYHSIVKDSCFRASAQFMELDQKLTELEKKNQLILSNGNEAKDRYNNVKPYEHNVVRLLSPDEYINASRICLQHCSTDRQNQCTCVDCYLVTQGPLGYNYENKVPTIGDFWRMAHQYNAEIIVNLTQCVESYKEKCAQYWPDNINVPETHSSGGHDIVVTLVSMVSNMIYDERVFTVSMNGERKSMTQLHLTAWPDHGCPNIDDFLDFYNRYYILRGSTNTVIIHCSAGVGRSGSFLLIDIELRKISSPFDKITILNTLMNLRLSRCHMVQTEQQYVFVHSIIFEYLKRKGIISGHEKLAIGKHVQFENTYENPCFQ